MSKRKWFFKRGNARLSWETLPEWAEYVVVAKSGTVWACENKPDLTAHGWLIDDGDNSFRQIVARVGHYCPDWQSLIFERPKKYFIFLDDSDSLKILNELIDTSDKLRGVVNKLMLPIITAEEWAAIRLLSPGAEYVAKDKNGNVYVYNEEPYIFSTNGWWKVVGEPMRVRLLEDRFASVPWRESRVKYEPPQENFSIKVTCACGKEVLVDDEPIYGVWAKRNYTIPCPNCHANLKIRVKYEAAD